MREYKFKKGFEAKKERLEEILRKYFRDFIFDGEFYVVRNFGVLEEMKVKIENKKLFVETKTRILDDETSLKTLKIYNKFLEELTGYSARDRIKMLMKDFES